MSRSTEDDRAIQIARCGLGFECEQRWQDMRGDDAVRHCESCRRDVVLVRRIDELRAAVRLGQCVAIATPAGADPTWVGDPQPPFG